MFIRTLLWVLCTMSATSLLHAAEAGRWENPIRKTGRLNSPLVETTPFVFNDRLYRLESWQKLWDTPGAAPGTAFHEDSVRVWDVEADKLVSTVMTDHAFGFALVWEGRVYVLAGNYGKDKPWRHITEIDMSSSDDLLHWTEPKTVFRAQGGEHLFNVAVCRGKDSFVMLYETDDPAWPAFTFKYLTSDDLLNWRAVPDAIYGRSKYVGGPALYYEGGHYYTLYLQDLGGKWETRVTRSKDLLHWQDAPQARPFVTFDESHDRLPLRPPNLREVNASDAEMCLWQGRTIIYFTGSDQQVAGDLQSAQFDGTPRQLLEHFYQEPQLPTPSARQLAYHEKQLGAFVHFGLASFIGGDMLATPEPAVFNPTDLDAEQWAKAANAMGARHIVLTTKHHSGFCLWPTKTTDYSVRSSPWRGGQGDVVRDFVDAARKHGLVPGFYFSAGDKHFPCTSTPDPMGQRTLVGDREKYFPVMLEQLRELLTDYGDDLCVLWFDGAYDPIGWDVKDASGAAGRRFWDEAVTLAKKLQPNAVIFGTTQPDMLWCGNEEGLAAYPQWYVLPPGAGPANYLPEHVSGYLVPEADVHTRPTWFWTAGSDEHLRPLDQLLHIYHNSIGHGANLLINLTPDNRGLVPDVEFERCRSLGDEVRRRFGTPLATTSSDDRWGEANTLDLDLGQERSVDHVVLEEDLQHGQRVRSYQLQARVGDAWKPLADGQSIGRKRIQTFDAVRTRALRLQILETDPLPRIRVMAAFDVSGGDR